MQNNQEKKVRLLDIQWGDKLILHDGRVVQVIETLDDIIKAVATNGSTVYIRRFQVKNHYPHHNPSYGREV
jgi:hypothetical protein